MPANRGFEVLLSKLELTPLKVVLDLREPSFATDPILLRLILILDPFLLMSSGLWRLIVKFSTSLWHIWKSLRNMACFITVPGLAPSDGKGAIEG
jgi:hypothetical protein